MKLSALASIIKNCGRCSQITAANGHRFISTGISMDAIDKPLSVAKAMIVAEIVRKTKKYEPRVEVARVEWDDAKAGEGILIPKVVLQVV